MLKTFDKFKYPLIQPRLFKDDLREGLKVLKSGQITISNEQKI